jgi:hypothetical protein
MLDVELVDQRLSVAALKREREETEALIGRARAEDWEGWGEIDAPVQGQNQLQRRQEGKATPTPIDAAQFVLGRPFPNDKRNHSYDRFPISYASNLRSGKTQFTQVLILWLTGDIHVWQMCGSSPRCRQARTSDSLLTLRTSQSNGRCDQPVPKNGLPVRDSSANFSH